MITLNAMIFNGKSTADLPFYCAVVRPPRPTKAGRKDKIYNLEMVNGSVKQKINAYKSTENEAEFYLYDVTPAQLRQFKQFIDFSGYYRLYNDPDMRYEYIGAEMEFSDVDAHGGYVVIVTFIVEPFAYENEITRTLGSSLNNVTNAPMYPLLQVTGNTATSAFIQIGNQRLQFPNGLQGTVFVECKHGYQDVYDSVGKKYNDQVKGPFFEILPGNNVVTKSSSLTVTVTERWCWL